jgi:uncharacterized protein
VVICAAWLISDVGQTMKLLVIADDDQAAKAVRESADVLISCGDLLDHTIAEVGRVCAAARIFAVKGNHDTNQAFPPLIADLHLRTESHDGLVFGGFHGSWRYKPRGHFLYDQGEVDRLLAHFPPVDIFVAHNSPRHIHDREDDVHFGFEAFASYIQRVQPRLVIHGHQHVNRESQAGRTRVIGVFGAKVIFS